MPTISVTGQLASVPVPAPGKIVAAVDPGNASVGCAVGLDEFTAPSPGIELPGQAIQGAGKIPVTNEQLAESLFIHGPMGWFGKQRLPVRDVTEGLTHAIGIAPQASMPRNPRSEERGVG